MGVDEVNGRLGTGYVQTSVAIGEVILHVDHDQRRRIVVFHGQTVALG
jgi:hypothetical protein